MIILPTKGRPANLERFVKAYNMTCGTLPIHVVFDKEDAFRYDGVKTPSHWKRVTVPAGHNLGQIFNLIFEKFPTEEYYGMVADDVVPETAMWDVVLRDCCLPNKISWGACGIQDFNLPVHPFIGGDLLREFGWWAAPTLKHWFIDNVWKMMASQLDCGVYLPQIKMSHHHYVNGLARKDRTYEEQPNPIADERNFRVFSQDILPQLIEKVKRNRADASATNASFIPSSVPNC